MNGDDPIIKLFEAQADVLEIVGSADAIDDAIAQLAGWMGQADLSEDDAAVLGHIGAVLFREGLRRRMGIRPGGISEEQRHLYGLALEAIGLRSPSADTALNQLSTVSAHSDDGGLRRLVKAVADAYGTGAHDPAVPIQAAEHSQAEATTLAVYCRHRLNDTF
ncbi:hypothetical protein [Burkholderia cenocepacia]|jgi:hypothetical protein|uniref:Uncharacterized protein n=1 Tax=Dechloromonas agitata TaxID=73030 RepID=A0A930BU31_9RHOO|nr:hypothetical protein [Burkholderia cenocepacia]MBF1165311.1 hypothetical protein [Dechloromonas agitata]MDI9689456.1 hypothetical protein [Burkholderia cenocepacia]